MLFYVYTGRYKPAPMKARVPKFYWNKFLCFSRYTDILYRLMWIGLKWYSNTVTMDILCSYIGAEL